MLETAALASGAAGDVVAAGAAESVVGVADAGAAVVGAAMISAPGVVVSEPDEDSTDSVSVEVDSLPDVMLRAEMLNAGPAAP